MGWGNLFQTGFLGDLRSFYVLTNYLIILFIFCLLAFFFPLFVLIWTEGGHCTNKGVTTMGVCWASGEASSLVGPPLNLVLYMHLRIFAYTSNTLIASFEYMDWIVC